MYEPSPELLEPDSVFQRLQSALAKSKDNRDLIEKYRKGEAPIKGAKYGADVKLKKDEDKVQYAKFLDMSRLNMCPLIVDSVVDDIAVAAFNDMSGLDSEDESDSVEPEEVEVVASTAAQKRWRNQHLSVVFKQVASDMCHHGEGYAWVSRDGQVHHIPVLSAAVESSPLDPWDRWAGLLSYKNWADQDAYAMYIKHPDGKVVEYARAGGNGDWETTVTPFTRIPIVPAFTPSRDGLYEAHLATIDRINFLILSRLIISDKQSFRELWIKGLPAYYMDPKTGEVTQIEWSDKLLTGPGGANLLPGAESDIKETAATDISPLTGAVFSEIKHLAALTSTPLYILDPSAAQQSALGADLADKVHRTKIRTLRTALGEAAVEWMTLSFEATGEPGKDFEVVWAPLEDESLAQRAQTAAVLSKILPLRTVWDTVLQLSPEKIRQMEAALQEEQANPLIPGVGMAGALDTTVDTFVSEDTQTPETEDSALSKNETFAPGSSNEPAGASASDFIQSYLQRKGGQAPARDVIMAGQRMGYTEQAIKTARSRLSAKIKFERQKNAEGRSISYWVLVS